MSLHYQLGETLPNCNRRGSYIEAVVPNEPLRLIPNANIVTHSLFKFDINLHIVVAVVPVEYVHLGVVVLLVDGLAMDQIVHQGIYR